jgi:AcrR family transcriptional regulator
MASQRGPLPGRAPIQDRGSARQRILDTTYQLFGARGLNTVGVDRISAEAGVTKKTLYSHFRSKEELALTFLDEREQRWTRAWLEAEIARQAPAPEERLLTLFDVLDTWFHRKDYESCSFICTLLETRSEADSAINKECRRQLDLIKAMIEQDAKLAGARDPKAIAYQIQILMMGAIVSASRGDKNAARRARPLAELLLKSAR